MKYSIDQLNEFMDKLQDEEMDIRVDRGQRYGNDTDTLDNVATFGADGVISGGFWECVSRIKNMYGKPKDLSDLKNAVQDLRNFAAYILCLETRELGQGVYNIPPEVTPEVTPQVVPWVSPEYGSPITLEGEQQ